MGQMCPHRLFLTLLVVSLPATAQDFSDIFKGTVTGETYLFVGDDLELNCSLDDPTLLTFTAYDITFKFQHQAQGDFKCIPQSHVKVANNKVAMLLIQNVTSANVGPYGCYVGSTNCMDGNNSNVELVNSSEDVFVEYAPRNVTNFQCEVYNWGDYMTCAWQHPVNYTVWSDIEVTTEFMLSGNGNFAYKCPVQCNNNCTWNKGQVHLGNSYYIETAVRNIKNNATASKVFVVNTSAIVKPAPVVNFSIAASNETSGCLVLSWSHSDKHNEKKYRIKYENGTLQNVTVTNVTTCGYPPYTQVRFSVQCCPTELYSGYWSEPANASILTPMTAPGLGPQAKNGSFMTTGCVGGSRRVTLMWQEVEAAARNGLIDHYLIKMNNGIMVNVSADVYSANVPLPCYFSSQVEIFAHNKGGYSLKPTVLDIPPITFTVPTELQDTFSVNVTANHDASKNSTTYGVMWHVSDGARDMNYTIFWCTGSPGKPCKGPLHWSDTIAGTDSYYDVHLQDSDVEKYIFGISVTDSDTGASSGIFWTKCLFSHNPFTSHAKTVEDLKVEPDVEKATIFWSKVQCSYQSLTKVTGYKVRWCETGRCNVTNGVSSVDVPATASMYTASALTADTKYSFTVQPVSYEDVGDEVQPWVEVIPGASENKAWITIVLISIFVPGIVILAGAVLYCKCRKRYAMTKRLVPEHFLALNGPVPHETPCIPGSNTSRQATVGLLSAPSNLSDSEQEDIPQGIHSQDRSTNLYNPQQSSTDQELVPSHSASAQSYHHITYSPPDHLSQLGNEHQNQEKRMFQISGHSHSGTNQLTSSPPSQSPYIIPQDRGSVSSNSRSLDYYHLFANCSSPEPNDVFNQDERADHRLLPSGSDSLPSYQHVTYRESDQPGVLSDIHNVDHQHQSLPSHPGSLQTDLSCMCGHEAADSPDTVIPLAQHTVSHLQYDNEHPAHRTNDQNHCTETGGNVNNNGLWSALTPAEPDQVANLTPDASAQQGHTTVDVDPSFKAGTEVNASDASPLDTSVSGEDIMLSDVQSSNDYVPRIFEAGQHMTEAPSARSSFSDAQFSNDSSSVPTEYIQMTTFSS